MPFPKKKEQKEEQPKEPKYRGHGILSLKKSDVIRILKEYPMTTTLEEICVIRGCYVEGVDEEIRVYAERKIRQNMVKLKSQIRDKLVKLGLEGKKDAEGNVKALITVYQLVGDDDDLRRLGTPNQPKKELGTNTNRITIQSSDDDTLNKLLDI